MVYRASICSLLFFSSMTSLFAKETIENEAMPSMAFLEFIGDWETDEGEWFDPLVLEKDETEGLLETISDENNRNSTENEN